MTNDAIIPFTDESIDPTDPVGGGKDFAMLAAGSAVLIGALSVGYWGVNRVKSVAGDALGVDMSDSDSGNSILV